MCSHLILKKRQVLVYQEIENLKKDGTLKAYEISLNDQGIQKGDPMYMRAIAAGANRIKSGLSSFYSRLRNQSAPKTGVSLETLGTFGNKFKRR